MNFSRLDPPLGRFQFVLLSIHSSADGGQFTLEQRDYNGTICDVPIDTIPRTKYVCIHHPCYARIIIIRRFGPWGLTRVDNIITWNARSTYRLCLFCNESIKYNKTFIIVTGLPYVFFNHTSRKRKQI